MDYSKAYVCLSEVSVKRDLTVYCTLNFRQYASMGLPHGVSVIVGML